MEGITPQSSVLAAPDRGVHFPMVPAMKTTLQPQMERIVDTFQGDSHVMMTFNACFPLLFNISDLLHITSLHIVFVYEPHLNYSPSFFSLIAFKRLQNI